MLISIFNVLAHESNIIQEDIHLSLWPFWLWANLFAITPKFCLPGVEAPNTNFNVFCLTQLEIEPKLFPNQGKYAYLYTSVTVLLLFKNLAFFCIFKALLLSISKRIGQTEKNLKPYYLKGWRHYHWFITVPPVKYCLCALCWKIVIFSKMSCSTLIVCKIFNTSMVCCS